MLKEIADECIPRKNVCKHSKGWWNAKLTALSKEAKRAKRRFAKRSDEANERQVKDSLEKFTKEEAEAKGNYLEDMVKTLDPRSVLPSSKQRKKEKM